MKYTLSEDSFDKVKKAMLVYGATMEGWKLFQSARTRVRGMLSYHISVPASDPIYEDLHSWLLNNSKGKPIRSFQARTKEDFKNQSRSGKIGLFYDGRSSRTVRIDGHRVLVWIGEQDSPQAPGSDQVVTESLLSSLFKKTEYINFQAFSKEGLEALKKLLVETVNEHYIESHDSQFFSPARYGEFQKRMDLPGRQLSSIVLKDGQIDNLVKDMDLFMSQEQMYADLGLPYHRGYLLYGPPGTGKSSLAKALATHYKADIYYLPLSNVNSDNALLDLLACVKPGSFLLLEDIDIVKAASSRGKDKELTLAGLLNGLDGLSTPHGLITIMTTNNIDTLDKALIRPGRVDYREELSYIDSQQLRAMIKHFYDTDAAITVNTKISPARIVEIFKTHHDDVSTALDLIRALGDEN